MDRGLCFATGLPLRSASPSNLWTTRIRRPRSVCRSQQSSRCVIKALGETGSLEIYPDASVQKKLVELLDWCAGNGIRLHSVEVLSRDGQCGLYATDNVKSGDPIISIPGRAAIIADIAGDEPPDLHVFTGLANSFWRTATWEVRLAVLLLDECARSVSPFRAYLNSLPKDPWCALWGYETVGRARISKQLEPYHLHNVANDFRAHVKHTFISFRKALPHDKRSLCTLKSFSWAVAVCQNRGFGIPQVGTIGNQSSLNRVATSGPFQKRDEKVPVQYALFPGLDMANHSVHCQTSFRYDAEADIYRVYTGANFSRGQQVFLSYGSKSNDDLMFFYSFVEGNNPANTVKLADFREWILDLAHEDCETDADWDRKLTVLRKNKLTHPDKTHAFQLDKVPDGVMLAIRVAVASSEDLTTFLEEMDKQPSRLCKAISLENELDAWRAIDVKCQQLLQEAGGFNHEEQETLTAMYSEHPCSAVWRWGEEGSKGELMYRYERQTILSATSERVRHFAQISSAVGRVCTVLIPPSQSLLKTDLFSGMGEGETAGVHRFAISPEDLNFAS